MAKANYSEPFKSNCQDGISYIDAFLIVRDKGVPQLNLYPYTPSSKGCSENPKPTKTAYSDAVKTKIAIFQRPVRNIDNFKRILVDTPFYPICIGTVLSSEYDHAVENGGMWKAKGISTGKRLHAMLIVGFNNKKNAFKVMDWQGDKYGDKGFIWLDYSLIDNPNVVFDAYICSHQTEYLDYRIGSRTGSATEEDTSQSAIPNSVFVNDQVQFWIKSGYYTQKDRFKITCLFVGDGVNKATFRVEDNKTNLLVKDNIMISEGSSKCFDYEGVTYKLKLLEIANRGKNIFKKAAIVNFTRNVVCETNNIINNKTQ
jgi:hypothetical protein